MSYAFFGGFSRFSTLLVKSADLIEVFFCMEKQVTNTDD